MRRLSYSHFAGGLFLFLVAGSSHALDIPGADGSDQALTWSTGTKTIALGEAITATWDTPSPSPGKGVYDPEKWAVVYKYSSVSITGGNVQFTNHPSGAPVVWLVSGNVNISGNLLLNGAGGTGNARLPSEPGPGGFRGGRGRGSGTDLAGEGMGPGGGRFYSPYQGGGGSYATAGGYGGGSTYGNVRVLPLIGGSGGAADPDHNNYGAGAGGGAILIACTGTITISGSVQCRGGYSDYCGNDGNYVAGGGSGGAIRLVADQVAGSAQSLTAYAGCLDANNQGGQGRIRLEANSVTMTNNSVPPYTLMIPPVFTAAEIWPPDSSPILRVLTVGGETAPTDPESEFVVPGDVFLTNTAAVDVVVEAENMPTDWTVEVYVTNRAGDRLQRKTATLSGGNEVLSTWTVQVDPFPSTDFAAVQARAFDPTP